MNLKGQKRFCKASKKNFNENSDKYFLAFNDTK